VTQRCQPPLRIRFSAGSLSPDTLPALAVIALLVVPLGACKKPVAGDASAKHVGHLVDRWLPACQPMNAGKGGLDAVDKKSFWRFGGLELTLSAGFHCLEEGLVRDHLVRALEVGHRFGGPNLEPVTMPTKGAQATWQFQNLKCSAWFDDSHDGGFDVLNLTTKTIRQKRYCMKVNEDGACPASNVIEKMWEIGNRNVGSPSVPSSVLCRPWPIVRFVPEVAYQTLTSLETATECDPWYDPKSIPWRDPKEVPWYDPRGLFSNDENYIKGPFRQTAERRGEEVDSYRLEGEDTLLFFTGVRMCRVKDVRRVLDGSEAIEIAEFAQLPGRVLNDELALAKAAQTFKELAIPLWLAKERRTYQADLEEAKKSPLWEVLGEMTVVFQSFAGIPAQRWLEKSGFASISLVERFVNPTGAKYDVSIYCSKWYDDFFDGSFGFVREISSAGGALRQKRFCSENGPGLSQYISHWTTLKALSVPLAAHFGREEISWPVFRLVKPHEHAILGSFGGIPTCTVWHPVDKGQEEFVSTGNKYAYSLKRTCEYSYPAHWVTGKPNYAGPPAPETKIPAFLARNGAVAKGVDKVTGQSIYHGESLQLSIVEYGSMPLPKAFP
jgi:hypothetical protein